MMFPGSVSSWAKKAGVTIEKVTQPYGGGVRYKAQLGKLEEGWYDRPPPKWEMKATKITVELVDGEPTKLDLSEPADDDCPDCDGTGYADEIEGDPRWTDNGGLNDPPCESCAGTGHTEATP